MNACVDCWRPCKHSCRALSLCTTALEQQAAAAALPPRELWLAWRAVEQLLLLHGMSSEVMRLPLLCRQAWPALS